MWTCLEGHGATSYWNTKALGDAARAIQPEVGEFASMTGVTELILWLLVLATNT